MPTSPLTRAWPLVITAACLTALTGCESGCLEGIPAVSAHRVPPVFLETERKDELQELSISRLRQDPPPVYQLAPGDVLGIYIENVLGTQEELPPVNYPEDASRPPAVGYPVPIREDGTVSLPFVKSLSLEGLSLVQATSVIRKAYTVDQQILKEGSDRILVTLIRPRSYRVLVVREESGGQQGVTKRGSGFTVDLPAYENDVLHALNETGGLPGLDAKNEVLIYRSAFKTAEEYDELVASIKSGKGICDPEPPVPDDPSLTRIPLRFPPNKPPEFGEEDIILENGDVVMIRARDEETFYTGGVLGGQEIPLPRDKDLDVIGAIALAGGQVGGGQSLIAGFGGRGGGFGGRGGGGREIFPATRVIILRTVDNAQIPIKVNLFQALRDPRQRILIKPKDVVILQYTLAEDLGNAIASLIQFQFLFNGLQGFGGGSGGF